MKLAITTLAASLGCAICSTGAAAPPMRIEPGKSFSLKAGDSAQTVDGLLHIGFEGVDGDSRCPKGERCIWAGDAIARVWLQQGTGTRQTHELHTAANAVQAVDAAGRQLRLVELDPYPVAGAAIAPQAYLATLVLSNGTAAAPDR